MKYLIITWLALLAGCRQAEKVEALHPESGAVFQLCKGAVLPGGLSVQLELDTTAANQLVLNLLIKNSAQEAVSIDANALALLTQDQRRHQPLETQTEALVLAPGEERLLSWNFQPVNDLYLYQHSGLHGSLQQRYQFPLSFISGLTDTVAFCFPEEAFLHYSQKEAQKKPLLFRPAEQALTPQAAARQEVYYAGIVDEVTAQPSASTHFSDQEFFTAGVNLRHALYQQRDSLYLKLYLINHAPYELALNPKEIYLWAQGVPQQPLRIERGGVADTATYLLRKGDRVPLMLVYKAPAHQDSLLLSLQGIRLAQFQKPLFKDSVFFIRQ